jgi:hypothetical protein
MLLAVLALVTLDFAPLPDIVPLHFDASGQASQLGPKTDLLRLPLLGWALLMVDWALGIWAHPRDALLARVLWVGGAALQAVLLVAVLRLLG